MVQFINATEQDLATIEEIARKTWPDTFGKVMPIEQIAYMLDKTYNQASLTNQLESGHTFVLIKHHDATVGFTSYELNYRVEA